MDKRGVIALIAFGLCGIAFGLCTAPLSLAATATKLTLGMPTTPPNLVHIGPWVAKEQRFFADEGLDVEITTFEGGVYVIRNVVSGALDAGAGVGATVAVSIAKKAGIKTIFAPAPKFASTLTARSSIKTVQDLKGKKLGVQEIGGFADVMSRMVLGKAGIKPEEVTFIPIASADVPPLLAGQIDTAVLHMDQLMMARQKDPSFHPLVKFWELEPNQLFLVMVAQEKKLAAEPTKYQALVRALAKANRFMYSNKAKTVEVAVKYAQIPRDVAEAAYDEFIKGKVWAQNDGLPRAKVEYTIDRMVKVGSIKPEERPKYEDYVAVSIVEEAMKRLPRVPDYD
ncbi:MAG TPA: ABC transporter substrate-binding protein [Candidatus Binatia bacterium]|jgi:ABC-type nitrate/sulfonate/bicarbonate transport system substrate-binding protein